MARPQKVGLNYFPLDNNISDDDKVFYIESEHGIVGFGVYIKLLTRIYDNGYYIEWDKFRQKVLARKVNVDINILLDVVNSCIECGLFDKSILKDHNILTSKAIQKRYFEATSRRKSVEVSSEYCLINVNDYNNIKLTGVNVDINPKSDVDNDDSCKHDVDINPQSKEEKSKEEKSKEDNDKNDKNEKNKESIYRKFDHLKMTVTEYERLLSDGYSEKQINTILDNIENYADNTKYKSLNLTARNWLKREEKKKSKVKSVAKVPDEEYAKKVAAIDYGN